MIYSRFYEKLCRRFGYWPWLLLVAVFCGLVLFRTFQKNSIAETEKQLAINACSELGVLPDCSEQIESRHEACFEYNFHMAAMRGTSRLDRKGYRECLEVGFETYIAELREQERQDLALQKKLLE